jgi:hypothetical protein
MKGVAMAHDVTKTNIENKFNGAVTITITANKVETQVLKGLMLKFRRKLML